MFRSLIISSLLLPLTAFGTITVVDCGTGSDNASSSSAVITTTTTVHAGSTGIIAIALDNAGGASTNLTATSYTDSVGNIWYVRQDVAGAGANGASEHVLLTSQITTNLTSSNTLTVSLTLATVAKAWTITEATGAAGNIVLVGNNSSVSQSGVTTPSITTFEVSANDLVFAFGSAEWNDNWTGVASPWSTKQSAGAGTSSATGMSVISQWQISSSYATKTFNPTLANATDTHLGYMIFTETDAKARVNQSNTTAEASTVVTFTNPIPSGRMAVLCMTADNMGLNGAATNLPAGPLTDLKSNTWTKQINGVFDNGIAGTGVEIGVYTSPIGSGGGAALLVGDTLTIGTYAVNVTAKCWSVWEFAPSGAGSVTYVTGALGTGNTGTSASVTTSSIASGDYVLGLAGGESANTFVGDAGTTNGTWKSQCAGGKGASGAGAMSITSQWKLTTAAGAQTYNPTLTSADWMIGWIELNDSSPTGLSNQQKAGFFMLFP